MYSNSISAIERQGPGHFMKMPSKETLHTNGWHIRFSESAVLTCIATTSIYNNRSSKGKSPKTCTTKLWSLTESLVISNTCSKIATETAEIPA